MTYRFRATLGALVLALVLPALGSAAKLSAEDLFKNYQYTQMTVSPSGKYLAALAPARDRRNIAIIDLEDRSKSKFVTGLRKQDIAGYTWASDEKLVFTVDSDGNESFGLYVVDRKSGKQKTLVEPDTGIRAGLPSAGILDTLPKDPDHILVTWDDRRVGSPDVYKVNLKTAGMKMIERNPGDVTGWMTDHNGEVRAAFGQDKLFSEIRYRKSVEDEWQAISRYRFNANDNLQPMGFDYDNKHMFVSTNSGHDKAAIYRYNPETQEMGKLVFSNDEVDPAGLMMSDVKQKLIGVAYVTDKTQYEFFDDESNRLWRSLQAAFPDKMVTISSRSKDEKLNVVTVGSDTDPGSFYLFNSEDKNLEFLAARADWLDPAQMSPMRSIKFQARDGLRIQAYLTLPQGMEHENLPLIINPHGGPFGVRDNWGFNPEHQFLASRGYAVMQVNYRGSGGFGKSFLEAGYKKWGREMQNDLTDAVKWAVAEGIADEKRVCIYGGSYGGYATMAGMTFTPELYRCGVNYVGVTDVPLLFESMPKRWTLGAAMMKEQIGDPEKDMEMLEAISPVHHVENIAAPIFIVHGRRDPRVVFEHAKKLQKEMDKHGKPYQWLVKNDEGHGFRKQENRIELYNEMEKFFAEHL